MSEKLLQTIPEIQIIFNSWNPIFKIINIQAKGASNGTPTADSATFFSAGVDSLYTAIKHRDSLQALILINGFDFNMETDVWSSMVARNNEIAQLLGKRLILVETNLKEFTSWFNMARYVNFGASLATVAQLLNFGRVHISGHDTFEKISPAGAHPVVDPLWSTEKCAICHTGLESDRTGKIALISKQPELLEKLWVCWKDPRENCGKCSKCIRSYVAMRLCGIDDFKFSSQIHLSDISKQVIEDDERLSFFEYFRRDAQEREMPQLVRALDKAIMKYKTRRYFLEIDKCLFRSKLGRLRNLIKQEDSDLTDINLFRRHSDQKMLDALLTRHQQDTPVESQELIGSVLTDTVQ